MLSLCLAKHPSAETKTEDLMKLLEGYNTQVKIMHWLMAVLMIALIAAGLFMVDLPKDDPLRPQLYMIHKSSGM